MVCLGLEPGAAGWKAQTNPLSYSGTPSSIFLLWECSLLDQPVLLTLSPAFIILNFLIRKRLQNVRFVTVDVHVHFEI